MSDIAAAPALAGPAVDRASIVGYLNALFDRAAAIPDASLIVHDFRVARMTIRARFSDPAMARLYSSRLAGGPFPIPADPPDITIHVLETSRLGWQPPAHWRDTACDGAEFDQMLTGAGLRAVHPYRPRLWEVIRGRSEALQLTEQPGNLPPWDPGSPLRLPLHWASLDRGNRIVHGGTLGIDGKAVLLVGPGGSGKSGTVLGGIAHGLQTVGDDYVWMAPEARPVAKPVFCVMKQDPAGLERLPGLRERLGTRRVNWQGKIEFNPEIVFPGCMAGRHTIGAIVIPRVARQPRSTLERVPAQVAFQALARPTLEQFPGDRDSGLLFCAGLTRRVPCYRLALSEDPAEVTATLRTLIEGLPA